jgi:hypothetical protein
MRKLLLSFILTVQFGFGATVYWTDWVSASAGEVSGSITALSRTVDVNYSGSLNFALTSGGSDYWDFPATYTSPEVSNAPPSDLISITGGTANTLSFSSPVVNPILAIISLNGPGFTFAGNPSIEVLNSGCGVFGCGTLQVSGNVLSTAGGAEGHGLVRLNGTFTSITFAGGNEYWRGIQVGITDAATVPEPGTWISIAGGLVLLAFRRRA